MSQHSIQQFLAPHFDGLNAEEMSFLMDEIVKEAVSNFCTIIAGKLNQFGGSIEDAGYYQGWALREIYLSALLFPATDELEENFDVAINIDKVYDSIESTVWNDDAFKTALLDDIMSDWDAVVDMLLELGVALEDDCCDAISKLI
jgi:hypothetical protein